MRQFYDMLLLIIFIVLICVFMLCCQNRSRRASERNAKLFEMNGAQTGESELEYEDIQSSEMDNDNNDDIELIESGQKSKNKNKKRKFFSKKQKQSNKYNDIRTADDVDDDVRSEDVFSDSTDDEMSMAKMREEYYKSQTIGKKFMDLMDDIRELLNGGKAAMQKKFKKRKPMIVRPMIMSIDDKHSATKQKKENSKDHSVESESDEKVQEEADCV